MGTDWAIIELHTGEALECEAGRGPAIFHDEQAAWDWVLAAEGPEAGREFVVVDVESL